MLCGDLAALLAPRYNNEKVSFLKNLFINLLVPEEISPANVFVIHYKYIDLYT